MNIPRIASYRMPEAGDMPVNRVNWTADPRRAVLLVHDMQEYFVNFFEAADAPVPSLVANITALRVRCDTLGIPVIYTAQPATQSLEERGLLQDWWGPGLTAHPDEAGVLTALAPRAHDTVLVKWRYSGFARTDLLARMKAMGRDQLVICGVYAHIGCMVTAIDAFMNDVQPFYVGDAVADFSLAEHRSALDYVSKRCGMVVDTRHLLDSLRPPAGSPVLPGSPAALRAEVAALLDLPATGLGPDDNLLYAGLDSIRLMTLAERWRAAGLGASFIDLAEEPTLNRWWALLSQTEVA